MEAVIANNGLEYFPVYNACYTFRSENSGFDWYVPALSELQVITNNFTELNSKWGAATGLGSIVSANALLATSSITGQSPYCYLYSIARTKAKWQAANDDNSIEDETKLYSVLPIATFVSK